MSSDADGAMHPEDWAEVYEELDAARHPQGALMKRGTVIEDANGKMWLCVKDDRDDDPVLGPINALMMCEDNRIEGPARTLKNVPGPVAVVAVPGRPPHCHTCGTEFGGGS